MPLTLLEQIVPIQNRVKQLFINFISFHRLEDVFVSMEMPVILVVSELSQKLPIVSSYHAPSGPNGPTMTIAPCLAGQDHIQETEFASTVTQEISVVKV